MKSEQERLEYLRQWNKNQIDRLLGETQTFWKPELTEQQKQEQDEYIKKWNLPF